MPADSPVLQVDNRAFMYGDGLFETIRVVNGVPCFFSDHFVRLTEGMKALKMEVPPNFTEARLMENCRLLIQKNNFTKGCRIRLTVFRNPGGFYLPEDNNISYTLVSKAVENDSYVLNDVGLAIDVYTDLKKPINRLANFKTLNTQLFVMASLDAKEKVLNDMLILNEKGNVIETTTSNIFLVSNGVLYTPSLEEGCLAGVMRMQIINLALQSKLKVYECALTPQRLLGADEIFITNTAKGIQWVNRYRAKRFYHKVSDFLLDRLNQQVNSVSDLPESLQEQRIPSQDF
ncbi:MAG: aminotransferase class IV [Bacteroidota bacterium]